MFLTILESGSMGVATAGISLAGSGTTAILLAGAVQVLIGIYKNTYRLAGPEEKLETPAPDTQQDGTAEPRPPLYLVRVPDAYSLDLRS